MNRSLSLELVVLLSLISTHPLLACSDDAQSVMDGGADAKPPAPDGSVPFDLPQGDAGHGEVGAKLAKGQVRAGKVTAASQLLSGIKVEGKIGDFKIYNSKVAFIIKDQRPSDGYAPFGGEILDAMRLGQPDSKGDSLLGEMILSAGIRILEPSSVGVVNDGSDGKAAIVRVIGEPEVVPILAALLGKTVGGSVPVHLVLDYVLEPESEALEIRWRFFNKTTDKAEIPMTLMGLGGGDGAEFFCDSDGFDVDGAAASDYVAMVGPTLAYIFFSADQELLPLYAYEGLWLLIGDSISVPAAGETQRTFKLGLTDGEPEAVQRMVRQLNKLAEPTKVSGALLDPSKAPVAGGRVHVQTDEKEPSYVTMARSDAQGAYSMALEPGKYLFTVTADGRLPTEPTPVQVGPSAVALDLAVGGTATLKYNVTDGKGVPIPSKLVFKHATPVQALPKSFGERAYPGGAALILFDTDGTDTVALPPGQYTVTASRGFEYEIDTASISLAEGESKTASFTLARSVDSTGYMCGDFHIHAMWSPDSSDLYEFKVSALAAEGLEIPVITDHDYVADLSPYIAKLGLQKWIRGMSGEEISPATYGHFNPYPITQDPSKLNMGAMIWYDKDPTALFAAVRSTWPDAVLQVNHPRTSSSGYFRTVGFEPAAGTFEHGEMWSDNFDALEVFNSSGWSSNKSSTVKDWFSLLDRGLLVTATGNSDSHDAFGTEVGYPRNYVKLSTDSPANLSLTEFTKAIKDQQVLVSGGPFVTVSVGGKSMGQVADASAKKAQIAIKVQAPLWMPVDTLQVFVGGVAAHKVTLDSSTADPTNPVIRYNSSLDLVVDKDSWVVVVVTGSGTLAPVSENDEPFALTNPIYLDVDGNGVYDPPKSF